MFFIYNKNYPDNYRDDNQFITNLNLISQNLVHNRYLKYIYIIRQVHQAS